MAALAERRTGDEQEEGELYMYRATLHEAARICREQAGKWDTCLDPIAGRIYDEAVRDCEMAISARL